MNQMRFLCALLLVLHIFFYRQSHAFVVTTNGQSQQCVSLALGLGNAEIDDDDDDDRSLGSWDRRRYLASTFLLFQRPPIAAAAMEATVNLNSLADLPPVTDGCVRIFLCRHGQTENNRLRKVQGARVDPPINENGQEQAHTLGKAIGRVKPSPALFFCSNLQRAKMTAEIAAAEVNPKIKVTKLNSLAEVDFGPVAEGQPVALAKAGMQATYAAWATGNIDFRPQEGGDSGREVMQRAIASITELASAAAMSKSSSCVAVTHSTFLRILLAMVLDIPLFEAASLSVVNGGVSVIDVPRSLGTKRLGKKSKLFSGLNLEDVDLEVPLCHVTRINETRHLPLL